MGTINNGQDLVDQNYAAIGGIDGADRSWAMQPLVRTLRGQVAADMATTAGGTIMLGGPRVATNPYGGSPVAQRYRVAGWRVIFGAAVTADNANNAVVTLNSYNTNGTSPTAVGTVTTNLATGNVVAGQAVDGLITAAAAVGPSNGNFGVVVTKGGTGVTLPAGTCIEVDLVPVQ